MIITEKKVLVSTRSEGQEFLGFYRALGYVCESPPLSMGLSASVLSDFTDFFSGRVCSLLAFIFKLVLLSLHPLFSILGSLPLLVPSAPDSLGHSCFSL